MRLLIECITLKPALLLIFFTFRSPICSWSSCRIEIAVGIDWLWNQFGTFNSLFVNLMSILDSLLLLLQLRIGVILQHRLRVGVGQPSHRWHHLFMLSDWFWCVSMLNSSDTLGCEVAFARWGQECTCSKTLFFELSWFAICNSRHTFS